MRLVFIRIHGRASTRSTLRTFTKSCHSQSKRMGHAMATMGFALMTRWWVLDAKDSITSVTNADDLDDTVLSIPFYDILSEKMRCGSSGVRIYGKKKRSVRRCTQSAEIWKPLGRANLEDKAWIWSEPTVRGVFSCNFHIVPLRCCKSWYN